MNTLKKIALTSALSLALTTPVLAAAPDGAGPWADSVVSSTQGLRKDGSPVLATRSNPLAALGVAENNTVATNFFSLGFGGQITLGFDNPIQSGVVVVEATGGTYPNETAKVEVSADNVTWVNAGTVTFDGTVNLPESVSCAKYVRLTDTSNAAIHPNDSDAYDVDGVRAVGTECEVPPTVPEFGLITGLMTLVGSAGSYVYLKRKQS